MTGALFYGAIAYAIATIAGGLVIALDPAVRKEWAQAPRVDRLALGIIVPGAIAFLVFFFAAAAWVAR